MKLKFSFADYIFIRYKLNLETSYYERFDAPPGFNKLPNDLKFVETQKKELINSPFILEGRISGGKRLFFTGLRPTTHNRIFYGDHFKLPKSKSLLFVVFSRDAVTMDIYFFNGYYPYNSTQRERNIQEFVEHFIND